MYGQTLNQRNQTEARRKQRSNSSNAARRFKQRSLYQPIRSSNKIALRRRHAIQHPQQWSFAGLMAIHEREARMDFCRPISQSESGVIGARFDCSDSSRPAPKQSKLVWSDLVRSRQYQWLGDKCGSLASWCLCKMAAKKAYIKKSLSPCGGQIDPSIYPYCGQMVQAIYPWCGSIRGYFDTFLYPPHGHLLVIPLYIAFIGD